MKIIQVTPGYPPSIGGVQNVAKEISVGLANMGHEVTVFTCTNGIKDIKRQTEKNLTVYYLKDFVFAHTPVVPMLFFRLLLIPTDSIMHVHISKAFIPEIVYLISKIRKIPYVAHFHLDVEPSGRLGFLLPIYKMIFLRRVLKNANKVVVLSTRYKDLMKNKYGLTKRILVIPNGVGEEFFLAKRKTAVRDDFNLLFVGRVSIQKNVACLVEAVSLVKNKTTLNIVGEGELLLQIEKMITKRRLINVILHGGKTGKELIDFYRKADIFLLASKQEGLPLVLLEAMAASVPVISSDVICNH